MDTIRQNKVARLLQKDISELFILHGREYYRNAMVTVTKVRVLSDLSTAKIYLSIFVTGEIIKKDILDKIVLHAKDIRRNLGNRVKDQLRIIPELEFFIDDSLDYIENIEILLKK